MQVLLKKINGKTKFIPIIIAEDNVKLPSTVHHIKQCVINDINNYDVKLDELVNDILGISKKPPLGTLLYLDDGDMVVFKKLGDFCSDNGLIIFLIHSKLVRFVINLMKNLQNILNHLKMQVI